MKIVLVIILFTLTGIKPSNIDLGVPEIQAVCKVTLKEGKAIEGFITFGGGGFDYKYRPHGFCLVHDNGTKQLILYNLEFSTFNLERNRSYRNGTATLCYVQNISTRYSNQAEKKFDEKNQILTITKMDVEKYQLLDKMVMYTKLPLDLFVGYRDDGSNGKITIPVDQIQAIELLKKPSKKFLDLIENARERQIEDDKKGEWVDYQPPAWYHEIITDQEQVAYLSQFF